MTDQQYFEMLGRKQAALDLLNAEYDNLLTTLAKVSSGEIDAKAVSVDLAKRAWKLRVVPMETVERLNGDILQSTE